MLLEILWRFNYCKFPFLIYLATWEEYTFEAPGVGLEYIPHTHGFIYYIYSYKIERMGFEPIWLTGPEGLVTISVL
jgi:hypothetical protein